jgi:GT2 family glycosyltransferase
MTNWIVMCAYGNVELTKQACESALAQDVGDVRLWVVDNGSLDQTRRYLADLCSRHDNIIATRNIHNESPVKVANYIFGEVFDFHSADYVLGIPNDCVLPPNLYRELLKWPRGIVCPTMTDRRDAEPVDEVVAVSEHTPLAVGLVRRWAYEALVSKDGYFLDPRYFFYASDCDLALRIAACGIRGIQVSMPYYHSISATLKNAGKDEAAAMHQQGDVDRAAFVAKWGFAVDAYEYGARAGDINFKE